MNYYSKKLSLENTWLHHVTWSLGDIPVVAVGGDRT